MKQQKKKKQARKFGDERKLKMDNEQVTQVALPNINSSDSEERIAARRLRVAKAEERYVIVFYTNDK